MLWSDNRLGKISWDQVGAGLHWETPTSPPSPGHARWMGTHSHRHSYDEILVSLGGEHRYGVDARVALLRPGSTLFIPRHIPHDATYSIHHKTCTDFWMHFLPDGLMAMKLVDHHPKRGLNLLPIPCPQGALLADFRRAGALVAASPHTPGFPGRKTAAFLSYLLQAIFEKLAEGVFRTASDDETALVESIKTYASRNLADRLTLEELARVAGYSPFHFHRMFLRIEGVTPRKFVLTQRLEFACRLLKEGRTITSVAQDAGFTDSAQFARTFKRHFQETPGKWRTSKTSPD